MATLNTRDPVQGLIDYVKDVKPYHSKILEVWVEYIYSDTVNATVKDKMEMDVSILFDRTKKYCKHGWDMYAWGQMLADAYIDEIVPGTIIIDDDTGLSVARSVAFQLYFDYLCDVWRYNNGDGPSPVISDDQTTKYWPLSYPIVMNAAIDYFAAIDGDKSNYWYEPASRKVFKQVGSEWHEQSAFLSSLAPVHPTEMDIWLNITSMTLFTYMSGTWQENPNLYISYDVPAPHPHYPPEWNSTWDRPECTPPYGETWVYAQIAEEIEFFHGDKLFFNEDVWTVVHEPGRSDGTSDLDRNEYPARYKTTISQGSDGRYQITRSDLDAPDDIESPHIITLKGHEADGFRLERLQRGVRLNEFLVWKFKNENEGMQLIADPVINRDTFGFRVENGALIAQSITSNGRVDIECPFNDGQIVYFTSSNDLPSFSVLAQDYTQPIPLMRYNPYRITKLPGNQFSVTLVKTVPQYDPITGNRYDASYPLYETDTDAMGASPYVNFVSEGHGDLHFGIGHPIAFMEVRTVREGNLNGSISDKLSSSTEAFPGYTYTQIRDVLIGFNDNGTLRNAFLVEGDYAKFAKGEVINVVASASNNGDWIITKATKWTNVELDEAGFPIRDGNDKMVPVAAPVWWNELLNGDWPLADLSGTDYYTVTTLGIAGTAPSTQYPFGSIALKHFNFSEPSVSQNIAQAQVKEKLYFGSLVWHQKPDGTWEAIPEPGAPGVKLAFKDLINATVQEDIGPNEYGIPTIGSYDIHYYDLGSWEAIPEIDDPAIMSISFHDLIGVSMQEQVGPNGYGIPTIGSFDVHYYDIGSWEAIPEVEEPSVLEIVFRDTISVSIQDQLASNDEYGIPTVGSYDVQYYDIGQYATSENIKGQ